MNNFMQMRQNMIVGQFLPGLIKNKKIIEFFGNIPRELFLPDQFQSLAYSDLNIKISNNRYVPSPFNTAKIFQEAELKGTEMILLIGANLGYEAVVVSKLVDTVVAIEENIDMKNKADANIKKVNAENVLLLSNKHRLGHKKLGPYDLIITLEPQDFIEDTFIPLPRRSFVLLARSSLKRLTSFDLNRILIEVIPMISSVSSDKVRLKV